MGFALIAVFHEDAALAIVYPGNLRIKIEGKFIVVLVIGKHQGSFIVFVA
jgi:hypothetical protein